MTDRELLLEILEGINDVDRTGDTQVFSGYTAPRLRELIFARLEQPEQEPVAWYDPDEILSKKAFRWCKIGKSTKPLYTTPQPAQKPLTDEQIENCWQSLNGIEIHNEAVRRGLKTEYLIRQYHGRAIEAAHNIK